MIAIGVSIIGTEVSLEFDQIHLIESIEMIGTVRRLNALLHRREEIISTNSFFMHQLNERCVGSDKDGQSSWVLR
jgi:hypothetical protein